MKPLDSLSEWFLNFLFEGGEAFYYNGRLCWRRNGQWIPLTEEEEADYVSRDAW